MTESINLRLTRPRQGRMLAGVSAALASRTGIDVSLVRIAFLVSLAFGGFGLFAYLVAWALIPNEGESQAPAERLLGGA